MTNYQYTLLFVDDEKSILNSLHRTFRNDDYKILLANSGPECLQVHKDNDVSIIISDQRMLGMTSAQFLAQSKFEAPHAIRILLTGYSDIEESMQSINEGPGFSLPHQTLGRNQSQTGGAASRGVPRSILPQ